MAPTTNTSEPQLIQLRYRDDPWKLLVACMLLNRTQRVQVDAVIDDLFGAFPTSEALAAADLQTVAELIRPLGFQYQRAQRLIRFSHAWTVLKEPPIPPEGMARLLPALPGMGNYSVDSYKLFVLGTLSVQPTDKELKRWLEWRLEQQTNN